MAYRLLAVILVITVSNFYGYLNYEFIESVGDVEFVGLPQRLAGATLLVFANKQDLPGALSAEDIKEV